MVVDFYEVEERTIKRYIKEYGEELHAKGYFLSPGNSLKEIKLHFFVRDINAPRFTGQLGAFTFRIFLDMKLLKRVRRLKDSIK